MTRCSYAPELYFFDTGLVAYLTRYSSPKILANDAMSGAILENYVVAELLKSYINNGKDYLLWYYQDKDNREVDMVMEVDGWLHPLEVKQSVSPAAGLVGAFEVLDKASVPRGKDAILCMRPDLSAVDRENFIVPVWMV